jgi:hypothetical protein
MGWIQSYNYEKKMSARTPSPPKPSSSVRLTKARHSVGDCHTMDSIEPFSAHTWPDTRNTKVCSPLAMEVRHTHSNECSPVNKGQYILQPPPARSPPSAFNQPRAFSQPRANSVTGNPSLSILNTSLTLNRTTTTTKNNNLPVGRPLSAKRKHITFKDV